MEGIPGFRFVPTDAEIITDYLQKKVMGQSLPWNGILEVDIYSDKSPWEEILKGEGDAWQTMKKWDTKAGRVNTKATVYILTPLKKKNAGGIRKVRKSGCGSWHGETQPKEILNQEGQIIGYKRQFNFVVADDESAFTEEIMTRGNWIMHEYTLNIDGSCGYALCKIMTDDSKKLKKVSRKRKRQAGTPTTTTPPSSSSYDQQLLLLRNSVEELRTLIQQQRQQP